MEFTRERIKDHFMLHLFPTIITLGDRHLGICVGGEIVKLGVKLWREMARNFLAGEASEMVFGVIFLEQAQGSF
jgi:hypothetical protein